ncbi:CaiB/BaiF CoA transferase family protein [Pandoraea nosoerga]|uniref:Acetyl-CoA:oxalate CoA-transferase n=1 Tax=Pandoraea nosoerga TaxID=2508296 RepID=A0A5E4W146_9BURK|nr:CoA transferase [Pandoraea nosoerga]VVE18171.1 Acetyl-CoA:oxalate CoA-transferase [Pandoraea nosoerga]
MSETLRDIPSSPDSQGAQPLVGMRVIEFAHWMAGPLAGGLLADWGADVIKIEPPGGEPMRALFSSLGARSDAPNGAFVAANRGKRSIELEIKSEDGARAFDALLANADVLLTNLRPDALTRLGLTPDAIRKRFPRLVYCSVSAYGWGGPDQNRPGYDVAAFFARTGISHEITQQDSAPLALMQGIGDSFTAMTAATGTLAALLERERTGRGQFVEASLLRTGMWALCGELGVQAMGGNPKPPYPRGESRTPLYNSYRTKDGRWFFLVGVEARRHVPSVLAAIGRSDLLADERFASARAIAKHRAEIIPILDAAFATQPMVHWAKVFDEHDVWWAPVQTPADLLDDPQAAASGAWISVEVGDASFKSVEAPIRFDGKARRSAMSAPMSGQHTDEVLTSLGMPKPASADA